MQFQRLGSNFTRGRHQRCSIKVFVRPTTLSKKRLWHRGFPVNFSRFLKTPFFQKTLNDCFCFETVAGFMLCNYIELPISKYWKDIRKKVHPYILQILQISFTRIFFSFSLTIVCLHCRLRKAYALIWAANRFVGSGIPKHNAFDLIDKFLKIWIPSWTFSKKQTIS